MLEDIWRQQIYAFFPQLFRVLKVFMLILCLDFVLEVISDLHMFYGKKAGITTDGSTMDLDNFEIKICTTSMDVKWILELMLFNGSSWIQSRQALIPKKDNMDVENFIFPA